MTYAEILMREGKRAVAARVMAECNGAGNEGDGGEGAANNAGEPVQQSEKLNSLLDHLLDPERDINNQENVDWCRWLIGGGMSYEDFSKLLMSYDNTALCGLVWTADFVAFRCRTCGISQCMSLCADCFKGGDHKDHDFNMFKSQAGGACDCGDSSVMKESGFCSQHHGAQRPPPPDPPPDLLCVAEKMMPRLILRLLQHLRINTVPSSQVVSAAESLKRYEEVIRNADRFLVLIEDLTSLGSAMRSVVTRSLTDDKVYERLTWVNNRPEEAVEEAGVTAERQAAAGTSAAASIAAGGPSHRPGVEAIVYETLQQEELRQSIRYNLFMLRSKELYEDALDSLPNPQPPDEFRGCAALVDKLRHHSFLEELVFWTVKYEFPEKLVCLLLKILPDTNYKEAFTRSFVLHYSRVSMMLVRSSNSDKLSNRIVHVSVQLFSNKDLAFAMTERLSLLHIMISSLKNMMNDVLVASGLHDSPFPTRHKVVDCSKHVMKHHCYWPLVSDLHNVLCHPPIAFRFMSDNSLLAMWFDFIKMFQGMNLNVRISGQHIEFEPNTYYASFSGELEAAASIMWAMVTHLKEPGPSRTYTSNVIRHCLRAVGDWMSAINFTKPELTDAHKASFHLPLHRYLSVFVRQAVKYQGFALKDLLPDTHVLSLLMMHPLRVQAAFYEIMCGLWVRNGLQIRGQAMTYIQNHFCKSMVDADLFLLQVCATRLPPAFFIKAILERFQMLQWLSLSPEPPEPKPGTHIPRDQEQELKMVESCLVFLVSVLSLRTNLGLSEEKLALLEMVSLLCMGDKTHSSLYEHMPEKSGTPLPVELFDKVLSEVAFYSGPRSDASGNMQPGMYTPKPLVWEDLFDPIYVLLRAVHRRDFQTSMERFNSFALARFSGEKERLKTVVSPWPPWRIPAPCDKGFDDPRVLLHSKYIHGLIFNLLYRAVYGPRINDVITSLAVHLLELAVTYSEPATYGTEVAVSRPWIMGNEAVDLQYETWYPTDCLQANVRHCVTALFTHSSPRAVRPAGSRFSGGSGRSANSGEPDGEGDTDTDEIVGAQRMEIDQLSDVSDGDDNDYGPGGGGGGGGDSGAEGHTEHYMVETPTSEVPPQGPGGAVSGPGPSSSFATSSTSVTGPSITEGGIALGELNYTQPLAITGPTYSGPMAIVPVVPGSNAVVAAGQGWSQHQDQSAAAEGGPSPSAGGGGLPMLTNEGLEGALLTQEQYLVSSSPRTHHPAVPRGPWGGGGSAKAVNYRKQDRGVISVNESIITLLLKLHAKLSKRPDSYVPFPERNPSSFTRTEEYRQSRVGDGCFFIEKVLDRIYEMDESCAASINSARKSLWPHYHAEEALRDEERERMEADAKKKRAKERQRQMMEALAQQRLRFMAEHNINIKNPPGSSSTSAEVAARQQAPSAESSATTATARDAATAEEGSSTEASASYPSERTSGPEAASSDGAGHSLPAGGVRPAAGSAATRGAIPGKEDASGIFHPEPPKSPNAEEAETQSGGPQKYTCCLCLMTEPAREDKPMGLVALIQSTSVLAHRRRGSDGLPLPTTDEEEAMVPIELEKSLGNEYARTFYKMSEAFNLKLALLSMSKGWESGVHMQSCGHHMHFHCRASYLETLKQQQQVRVPRDQPLDTDSGEFTCPMCRQMGNALLPVQPENGTLSLIRFPSNEHEKMTMVAESFYKILHEDLVGALSGTTPLRTEMANLMEFVSQIHYHSNNSSSSSGLAQQQKFPNEEVINLLNSIARVNLEIDVVHKGGSLVQRPKPPALTAIFGLSSSHYKTKFCFQPMLNVLSLHMKIISSISTFTRCGRIVNYLSEEWGFLTGLVRNLPADAGFVRSKESSVPVLMQDPITVLLHFVLLLPPGVDLDYYVMVTRACYNLAVVQVLVRACVKSLNKKQRDILIGQLPSSSASGGDGGLLSYLHAVISHLENTQLLSDPEALFKDFPGIRVPPSPRKDDEEEVVDVIALEHGLQLMLLPFLRVTALIRHYMFQQSLPVIKEPQTSSGDSGETKQDQASKSDQLEMAVTQLEFQELVVFLDLFTSSSQPHCHESKEISRKAEVVAGPSEPAAPSSNSREDDDDDCRSDVEPDSGSVVEAAAPESLDQDQEDSEMVSVEGLEKSSSPRTSCSGDGPKNSRASLTTMLTSTTATMPPKAAPSSSWPMATLSVVDGLNWFTGSDADEARKSRVEMHSWLQEYVNFVNRKESPNDDSNERIAQIWMDRTLSWRQPTLLKAPNSYELIFQFYHKKKCRMCDRVPKDPTVCLMCGTMVCLKEPCCRRVVNNVHVCESVNHAIECGGGTGIFLAVNSSTIVVIRGKRACIWGSIYLDMFGEEDKELKRGKPLFLFSDRYLLLENQWLTHRFDHTNRKWVFHRDSI